MQQAPTSANKTITYIFQIFHGFMALFLGPWGAFFIFFRFLDKFDEIQFLGGPGAPETEPNMNLNFWGALGPQK